MAKYAVKDTCIVLKRVGGEAALNELNRRPRVCFGASRLCGAFIFRRLDF